MRVAATSPGKLVVFGEYAVLAGAPALVMAVDRRCRAEIAPSADDLCYARVVTAGAREVGFRPPGGSGVPLLDLIVDRAAIAAPRRPWRAILDSSRFHAGATKLGIGASAAMLVAWAAAWRRYAGAGAAPAPGLGELVGLHRELQQGGSGLDVAASLTGGVITYRLTSAAAPVVSSVRLPKGVAFAGVFAGRSASTRDFIGRFDRWRAGDPHRAAERLRHMAEVAESGCHAVEHDDPNGLLDAVAAYGRALRALGDAIGADIVTAEHLEIGKAAERYGVVYKVSGAGGGDLGLAFSSQPDAIEAFGRGVRAKGYDLIGLGVDPRGLSVEERAE